MRHSQKQDPAVQTETFHTGHRNDTNTNP
uniref:Uncharacterized protein n=1 Tax=Arundo donax TaxID=35708 RepID=A0A0A9HV49_ARUDO